MKLSALRSIFAAFVMVFTGQQTLLAQTNSSVAANNPQSVIHQNSAVVPVPREDWGKPRQTLSLQRAKDAPGDYDIEFIGDSITEGWEGLGKNVWQHAYSQRKAINFGVSGDRTQHVLWRLEHG